MSQLFAGISGTPGVLGQPRVAPLQRSWGPATSLGARSLSPVPGAITRPRRCFGGPAQQPSPGGSPLRAAKRRAGPRGSSCVPRGSVRVGNGPRPAPGRERRTGNSAAALQRFFYTRGTICQGLQRSSSSQTSETLRNCTPPLSPLRDARSPQAAADPGSRSGQRRSAHRAYSSGRTVPALSLRARTRISLLSLEVLVGPAPQRSPELARGPKPVGPECSQVRKWARGEAPLGVSELQGSKGCAETDLRARIGHTSSFVFFFFFPSFSGPSPDGKPGCEAGVGSRGAKREARSTWRES